MSRHTATPASLLRFSSHPPKNVCLGVSRREKYATIKPEIEGLIILVSDHAVKLLIHPPSSLMMIEWKKEYMYGEVSIYFIKEENMRYGIYVAYWLKEWSADYYGLIEKAGKLGFDSLEISCAALIEQYASNADLEELKKRARDNGITLTAGYGPPKQYDLSSSDSEITKNALRFYRDILTKLGKLGITIVGGGYTPTGLWITPFP
jgi:hypothetical protein